MVRLSIPAAMSPCNVGNPFPAPLLTLEQVQDMFDDYNRCRELDVEATVVPDIFPSDWWPRRVCQYVWQGNRRRNSNGSIV